jgi:uncharacterized protein
LKLIVWIAVALIVGLWLLDKKRQGRMSAGERPADGAAPQQDGAGRRQAALPEPERMLPCAGCGVHVPASEALFSGDEAYCCAEHRAQRASRPQAPR